jgi:hypothetical protein
MKHFELRPYTLALIASALATIAAGPATAAAASSGHSTFAGIRGYLIASQQEEIALARSAAPRSVSMHATVMVLTAHGYITAAKGTNGFVCAVTRSWDNIASADSVTFWDPRIRVPKCFNPTSARSVLPEYLLKTQWVLAGASEATIGERVTAGLAAGRIQNAPAGSICYMMSKHSWGVGGPGPWRPHVMFYFPNGRVPNWGANLQGNPVSSAPENEHTTVFFVLVPAWSDGSPAPRF